MKKIYLLASLLALQSSAFAAPATLPVATDKASIEWTGTKVTGKHTGTIQLKSGSLTEDAGKISGGEFTIDMTTIVDKDLTDATYNKKLITHLKSDDFFSTEKNPEAKFVASKITHDKGDTYNIDGTLTIKGIANAIQFPATITKGADGYTVVADAKVDRTKYAIKYGSGKFFQGLGDKLIHDDFMLHVKLVAAAAPAPAKKSK